MDVKGTSTPFPLAIRYEKTKQKRNAQKLVITSLQIFYVPLLCNAIFEYLIQPTRSILNKTWELQRIQFSTCYSNLQEAKQVNQMKIKQKAL